MSKSEFMAALAAELQGIPQSEVQKIFEYYQEIFDDGQEQGKTEQEICSSLDSTHEIAERFRIELAFVRAEQKPSPKTIAPVLLVLLGLCVLPIGLPLLLTLFALAVSAVAVVVSLIASGVAIAAAFGIGGVACLITGFTWIFTGSVIPGLGMIGLSLTSIGLGVIGTIVSIWLIRAVFRGMVYLFRKIYQSINGRIKKKEGMYHG
ncbi:MAG: DUF1700 domain-containing protein [Oscillospiraceae bacterium]|nr:DUF1700 domain-containing protein [Oscillospiraceae bacterium]